MGAGTAMMMLDIATGPRSASLARSRCARALTLVETLVVIAIILALVAITMPVFNFVKSKAQAGSCASNLAQLHKASVMYADDHVGLLPCHSLQTHYWALKPGESGGTSPPPPAEYRDDYPPPL
jgi:type II secretory pathway pseudopilin PulG